jgi:hypothetical protein
MKLSHLLLLAVFSSSVFAAEKASPERLDEVRQHTQQVVPYAMDQTKQMFTKTVHGGVQHVVVTSGNSEQIKLVQAQLLKMANNFSKGDFSETERIHGSNMPGLAQLKMAKPYDIKFEYKALPDGAQIHYSTEYPLLAQALHEWFDAQASEHGDTVLQEHSQHHTTPAE